MDVAEANDGRVETQQSQKYKMLRNMTMFADSVLFKAALSDRQRRLGVRKQLRGQDNEEGRSDNN